MTVADRRARFWALHEAGCFVIPNPWDAGSAGRLHRLGFEALASTSAGAAWALGRQDGELTLHEVLAHLRMLCAATPLPVSADFEAGFADAPEDVAENVRLAAATGVAGISIEDRTGKELYDLPLAVARIKAARAALDGLAPNVMLVGRTEGYLVGRTDIAATIERMKAYADAGADVLFPTWVSDLNEVRAVVEAVAPKPVSIVLRPTHSVGELAAVGVRRVSVGGGLAYIAWKAFDAAALALKEHGVLSSRG
jgi:2-methylisocitrate lyase-like PEP mutase family enzyme